MSKIVGLDYSYKLFTPANKTQELINDLIGAVYIGDAKELKAAMPYKPLATLQTNIGKIQYGISGIIEEDYGHYKNHYCFSLPLPTEKKSSSEVTSYVGCVWTSIYVGEKWALIKLVAATSGISRDFEELSFKENIIKLFPSAEIITFNDETEEEEIIQPNIGRHKIPDNMDYDVEELDWAVNVNWWANYLTKICEIQYE